MFDKDNILKSPTQSLRFSVILAVFNGSDTIQQCIDSIRNQTYGNVELIIIDGGSSDGTVDLIRKNNKFIKSWLSEKDNGIYDAWNKGLKFITGNWVVFLGADDFLWDPYVLESLSEELESVPANIRVAYSKVMLLSKEGEPLYPIGESWCSSKKRFKELMCIPHQAVLHRKSLFDCHGDFDASFDITGDYELLLRELKSADAFFIPNLIVTGMRQGGISSDSDNALRLLRELRRAQKLNGLNSPGLFWIMALIRAYIRRALNNLLGKKNTTSLLDLLRNLKGAPRYFD